MVRPWRGVSQTVTVQVCLCHRKPRTIEYAEERRTVYSIQQWQVQWDTDTTGRHYNQIESTVSTRVKYKCRRTEVTITRLRLGKCKLNYYMHKINKHPTGLCSICNKDETVTHFLLECAASSTCRAVLLACSSLGVTPTLRNVLTDSRLHSVIISSLTRNI